jgi:eukaryotic-like serine/threonine-protein kinase
MEQTSPLLPAGKEPPQPTVDLSGRTLGEFTLLRRLGQGGMGQVYLAEQTSLKRKVALKVMRQDIAFDATSYQRFKAEAEAIARVTHANIVQVYAFGEEGGVHYMALEYVEGRNLREYLSKKGTTDTALTISILRQVAAALQRASEIGIIHRDIKPENILLTRRGEVKVADFGLSRYMRSDEKSLSLTQTGMTMGTPLYMSPEQVQGLELDQRTDIYSLGVTCFQMLSGAPPFRGKTAFELATQQVSAAPPNLQDLRPDLAPELCAMVHKMMAKEPARRYQNCSELLREISRLREIMGSNKPAATSVFESLATSTPGIIAHSPPEPEPAGGSSLTLTVPQLSRPVRWLLGTTLLTGAFLVGAFIAWARFRPPPAPPELPDVRVSAAERKEQLLRDALSQDVDPLGDRPSLQRGLGNRIELGLLYVRQRRLDEADKLFTDLMNKSTRQYFVFGRLGHGMVLAYQNRTAESNKVLRETFNLSMYPQILASNYALQYEVARALEFNKANASVSAPFPPDLERHLAPERPYKVK